MKEVKALLVFCEGSHDIAFVQQVFKCCLQFQKIEYKFSEYPAPFNALFKTSVQNHAAKDLSLNMAHKFFLPDSVWEKDERLILLFNSGGSSQIDKVKLLLKNFLLLLSQASVFPSDATAIVTEAKYLFLYDADHLGATALFTRIKKDFAVIEDDPTWSFANWIVLKNNPFGAIAGDKAAYIWGFNVQNGTLEDILLPMFEKDQEEIIQKATEFIDNSFFWDINNQKKKHEIAEISRRKKAIITCAGQREKSGSSMNVIIDQANLVSENTFLDNVNVKSFVDFLNKFM